MQEGPRNPARDEAFRKIGRNIALFQQLEMLLKHLVAGSRIEGGNQKQTESFIRRRNEWTARSTLGVMAGHFLDDVLGKREPTPEKEQKAPFIRTQFRVEGADYLKLREAGLAGLVEARNQLVHHLLDDFDLWNPADIQKLDALLDPQADNIRSEIAELKRLALERREMISHMAKHFEAMSEEQLSEWFGSEP